MWNWCQQQRLWTLPLAVVIFRSFATRQGTDPVGNLEAEGT
ncbi:hypothetical protein POX_b03314 [Penicillium oxalicum]|nr:hypothetical protein POX_b03314 [Penicillium oxalicum]KAI2793261.1 hypothetical protein POX_b03314 [Penicillium oxalicum]